MNRMKQIFDQKELTTIFVVIQTAARLVRGVILPIRQNVGITAI